jgi:glucokinase-like ROK family protein
MTQLVTGSFQLMKSLNKSLILNTIRLDGPISRAEIAKKTNLTPPTVTNLVGELLKSQLVVESDLGTSTGGRKPIMLRINSSAFQVIGIDVGVSNIKVVAATLTAEIIDSLLIPIPSKQNNDSFLDLLIKSIDKIMEKARLQKSSIIGIGVGMHGLVDPLRGVGIYAPNLDLRQIPIREKLEESLQIPVSIENDVRAMALGESWFGHGQGVSDFVCINVGMGVGAGIIIDNKLFHGVSYTAGEFGHTTIDMEGPKCSCGNYGCLQTLIAGPAIALRAQKQIRMGRKSQIQDLVNGDDPITGELIYNAALQGDELAQEVLRDTGLYLGIGIANLINLLNPRMVIIGGGVSKSGEFLMKPLRETIEARALETPSSVSTIKVAKLGDYATAIGAVTLVLMNLFVPSDLNLPNIKKGHYGGTIKE